MIELESKLDKASDNMSNPNDLLDPLRFKSLGEYKLQDIRDIGGGVFTQEDTLGHLELLDKIAKE